MGLRNGLTIAGLLLFWIPVSAASLYGQNQPAAASTQSPAFAVPRGELLFENGASPSLASVPWCLRGGTQGNPSVAEVLRSQLPISKPACFPGVDEDIAPSAPCNKLTRRGPEDEAAPKIAQDCSKNPSPGFLAAVDENANDLALLQAAIL